MNVNNFTVKNGNLRFELDLYPNFILQRSDINPTNIVEIGASNGDDSEYLRQCFDISPENVYCFEPSPNNFSDLISRHPQFKSFNSAVSNFTGITKFQYHIPAADISSFRRRINSYQYQGTQETNYNEIETKVYKMDDFLGINNIDHVDICKIDVEGCAQEVLDGFGNKLQLVKSLQIESETALLYEGQLLFEDNKKFLINNGFTMVNYFALNGQCDSLWIRNDLFRVK